MLKNERLIKFKDKIEKVKGKKLDLPTLDDPEALWVMQVFGALHGQRRERYAPLDISEIEAYMNVTNVPDYERTFLLRMLLSLDRTYREYVEEHREKDS